MPLAILLLGWPAITLVSMFWDNASHLHKHAMAAYQIPRFLLGGVGLGPFLLYWLSILFVYWLTLLFIARRWPKAFPTIFRPFLKSSGTKIVGWALFLSLAVLVGVCLAAA